MTRKRLEGLPINVLIELSTKENIDFEPNATRQELIENLLEAYEENLREREILHKLIIEMEESKFFYLSQDSFLEEKTTSCASISDSYDENEILFFLRDPTWAFVVWEVCRAEEERLRKEIGFRQLGLKIFEHADLEKKEKTYFFIPVEQSYGTRYIHLPNQNRWYHVELHALFDEESRLLESSSYLFSPLERPPFLEDPTSVDERSSELLKLSGIHLCEPIRQEKLHETIRQMHHGSPQRINNSDEIFFKDLNA